MSVPYKKVRSLQNMANIQHLLHLNAFYFFLLRRI